MDFELDEISRQVAATARDFAQQHIKPYVMEWDETSISLLKSCAPWVNWA